MTEPQLMEPRRRGQTEGERSGESVTIAEALQMAATQLALVSDDARLEAEVLLSHALGMDRTHLLAEFRVELATNDAAKFDALLRRRLAREPLAYIIGHREFFGIEIACSPAALIPRPESEMLVEIALAEAGRRGGSVRVADIGTGSGAIAVALAANAVEASITATDTSPAAIALARRNAASHGVEARVRFVETSLLDGLGRFDLILANLPYVSAAEWGALTAEIRDHEPRAALLGGVKGMEMIEQLLCDAPSHLAPDGVMALEIGAMQGGAVMNMARACFPSADVMLKRDLAGFDRVVVVGVGADPA